MRGYQGINHIEHNGITSAGIGLDWKSSPEIFLNTDLEFKNRKHLHRDAVQKALNLL